MSTEESDKSSRNNAATQPGKVVIVNPAVHVTLPRLKYGYRTTKATWPELVQIVNVENDIPKMSRSETQQRDYEIFRFYMNQQFVSSVDYILISKFGFAAVPENSDSEEGCKWRAKPSISEIVTPQKILVENDYPYYVENNIRHYVLWKTKESISEEEVLRAREELTKKLQAIDILHWVNPPNLQSLPEIDHMHFLCQLCEMQSNDVDIIHK
jgi:hypothetical protein